MKVLFIEKSVQQNTFLCEYFKQFLEIFLVIRNFFEKKNAY